MYADQSVGRFAVLFEFAQTFRIPAPACRQQEKLAGASVSRHRVAQHEHVVTERDFSAQHAYVKRRIRIKQQWSASMQERIIIAFVAMLFLVGASVTAEALFAPAPEANDMLSLPLKQQQAAWSDFKSAPDQQGPASFKPAISSAVPSTVTVRMIPKQVAHDVPQLEPYDFAKVQGQLLIINPSDMMIAKIMAG